MAVKPGRENSSRTSNIVGVRLGLAAALGVHVVSRVMVEVSPSYVEATSRLAERIGVRPEFGAEVGALVAILIGVGAVLGVAFIKKMASVDRDREVKADGSVSANGSNEDDPIAEYDVPSWVGSQKSPWGF